MEAGIFVPISLFAMVVGIVFITRYFKSRDQKELQETFRTAIEKGQQLSKEDLDVLRSSYVKPPLNDIRTGLILIAIAIGMAILGFMLGHNHSNTFHPVVGTASIPGLMGVVFVGFGIWRMNAEKLK